MANMADKKSNHISRVIQGVEELLDAIATLKPLQLEAASLGYTTGGANALADADFIGANGIANAAAYNAAISTLNALDAQLSSGSPSVYAILYRLHS